MDRPDTPNAAAATGRGTYPERWLRVWSHREDLLRVARRRSMSPEDAEDAVHEAMLRAAERPGLDDERLGGWLTTVTMRLCVDRHRQVTREAEVHRSPTLTVPGPVPVDEAVCDRDEARWLAARSAQLPERQAEALRLKSEGLDVGEVAQRMRLGYRTVESLLARARRTLRHTLAGTLGLAALLWGRGKLLASGPAQAVAVSSATAGLVVAGFVVPDAGGRVAPPAAGPRVAEAPTGYVRPVRDPSALPRVRETQVAHHGAATPPGRTLPSPRPSPRSTEEAPLQGLPTVALPALALPAVTLHSVSVLGVSVPGVTVSLPAPPPTPRDSAPDPAGSRPEAGFDGRNPPPATPAPRLDEPRKKFPSAATDRPRLPVEQVSEVRQHGRRGTGWVPRSVWKDLPSPSAGKWSGAMSR
ncbi:sigma-70 family RNA polymerase sigma factor [Streptomyces endophyticus]|uniref:Sigma-70 family RNA polymerase sigma factor n=2 Tax=Streptomyces endophyticus TaxID=714166 RepID=A0ABU6FAW1_9ACTN|nr:sigma-70 family RNA polymerase sigma factor [Streptomyces endophyticus]